MTARKRMMFGVLCALAGGTLWGLSGTLNEFLFARYDISPLFITPVRSLGAGALFLIMLIATKRTALAAMLKDRRSVAQLIVFGALGLYLCQITYIVSINYTNAGTTTVLQSANVVLTLGVTCLIAHRAPIKREIAGVICALAATFLIATKGDFGVLNIPVEGLVWGLLSAAATTLYVMYPKRLFERWGSTLVIGIGMCVSGIAAAVVWAVAAALGGSNAEIAQLASIPALDATGIAVLVVITLVGTFGAFGLYLHGVSIVGGIKGSLLGTIEPVSATVLSTLLLGTLFNWADWLGLVLMIATVFLVSIPSKSAPSKKEGARANR